LKLRSRPRGKRRNKDLGCRRSIAERGMWPDRIVVASPELLGIEQPGWRIPLPLLKSLA
jgi:hypothetical protein